MYHIITINDKLYFLKFHSIHKYTKFGLANWSNTTNSATD